MSTSTTNYNFVKPSINDPADITAPNSNWDKIDTTLKELTLDKFGSLGSNPIKNISDDTVGNWIKLGANGYAYFSNNVLNNQPSDNGILLHYSDGAYASQLFCVLGNGGKVWYRNGNTSAGWTQQFVLLSDLTNANGVLPVAKGGTGGTTDEEARTNLNVVSIDELPNLYVWKQYKKKASIEAATITLWNPKYPENCTIKYSDSISIENGVVSLINEQSIFLETLDNFDQDIVVLRGKYVLINNNGKIFFAHSDSNFRHRDSVGGQEPQYIFATRATFITDGTVAKYVTSKTNDTYPNMGEHTDGYWYKYNKQLGE